MARERACWLLALFAACSGSPTAAPAERPSLPRAHAAHDRRTPAIVVAIVVDQLASWVLEENLSRLDARGALRRGIARGTWHRRVRYPYAGTLTAPGHATLFTGVAPAVHGVPANERWDRELRSEVPLVDDRQSAVHGAPGAFASPGVLRVDGVADALVRASGGRSKVVSISMKDRGSVLPAGRSPTAVAWFDDVHERFTTSARYAPELPDWLRRFAETHPASAMPSSWLPLDAAMLASVVGRDDGPGEGDYQGLGTTFPHDLARARHRGRAMRATPQSTEWLLALARAGVEAHDLGRDAHVDLLTVSISGTDYVGHVFGPRSWEAVDNLVRTDRALGQLLDELESTRGPIAVLVTADHGVAPMVEASRHEGHEGARALCADLAARADAAVDAELGPGDWVDRMIAPFVFLSHRGRAEDVRPRVVDVVVRALEAAPGIHAARDVRSAAALRESSASTLDRSIGLSIPERFDADVFVVPDAYSIIDPEMPGGSGTSHGSPWDYDTVVPVVVWGAGVARGASNETYDVRRVAATLAAMLGIEAPGTAMRTPLPGVRVARTR